MQLIDESGKRYGNLVVLGRWGSTPRGNIIWECQCDCGRKAYPRGSELRGGHTKSCGCVRLPRKPKHALWGLPIYWAWHNMIQRCQNKKNPSWKNYGGRGIQVCERWSNVETFAEDMGFPTRGLSLDRINNDGNYEPSNCRWATRKQQQNNRRVCQKSQA